jgi:hypothetical protein
MKSQGRARVEANGFCWPVHDLKWTEEKKRNDILDTVQCLAQKLKETGLHLSL